MAVSPPRNRPGEQDLPNPPARRRRRRRRGFEPVRSDPGTLTREAVSAGKVTLYAQLAAAAQALPQPIDDLSRDFGNDVYEQMMLDAQVAACIIVYKAAVLEDGVDLAPAIPDQNADGFDQAVEIKLAAEKMFANLETPLDDVLWTMLDATCFGNKVAEICNVLERTDGRTMMRIRAIKPKPRQSIAFVVDTFMNLHGFVGAKPGETQPQAVGATLKLGDPQILARDKFAVLTWRPVDCDPRGTSMLRPAYEAWWRKRQMFPEYLKYLTQFAGPSMWGTTPEGVAAQPVTDGNGNPIDGNGNVYDPADGVPEDDDVAAARQDDLLQALLGLQNGTALAVPFGTEIHTIEVQGDGEAFLNCFHEADSQITHAVLTQQLATESPGQQARAAAQVHQDVLDTLVRQGKRAVVRMIQTDILKPWIIRNWGEDAADFVPQVSLGTTERQDLGAIMNAVAALARVGYIHPSQLPYVDQLLGFPVRDMSVGGDPMPLRPKPAEQPGGPDDGDDPRPSNQRQGQPAREPERERQRQSALRALGDIQRFLKLVPAPQTAGEADWDAWVARIPTIDERQGVPA